MFYEYCKMSILKMAAALILSPLVMLFPAGVSAASEDAKTGEAQLKFSDDIKEHFFLGGEFFQKKNFASALIEYNNIRQIDPAYIEGYFFTAKCYYNLKQYLPAAYFAAFALYLDPQNVDAKALADEIKSAAPGIEFKGDRITYKMSDKDKIERIVFDIYGSSMYLKPIIEHNGGKKDFAAGASFSLPLDLAAVEDVGKIKKFDGTTLQYDLEALKESILVQKEGNIKEGDAQAFYDISAEYFKINKLERALEAFETACSADAEFVKKKDPQLVAKAIAETKTLIKKDPKNSKAYFYLAFLQYVEESYRDSLSNFSYASSLGLQSALLQKSFNYSTLCKQYLKTMEAKDIERDAILKASADASLSNKIADVIKKTSVDAEVQAELAGGEKDGDGGKTGDAQAAEPASAEDDFEAMTKEQKMYYCYQQRKMVDEGVQKYNENNIIEMSAETFSIEKMRSSGYISAEPKCPDGGAFSMNHNGFIQCSAHGL
ncbi:MAG: hypothetical protein A2008_10960 [Candidatus Wallbacteria bacterium GWC2_49_35]|uniref:Tetratricopeptide repeat protein n=1 Tax=Candidatus Wallbacteria bacterium GWC2_49_35 TaxID=1817813 RepID=A0A1F7WGH4_9BACT|nr:MAG: hypothetical protein A2008_10960 [Candidatus Wallbacteria bacterium GWC2_49_35]HBC75019.1 hypothetical protein [Candidatus Wallbacteria bacterium]